MVRHPCILTYQGLQKIVNLNYYFLNSSLFFLLNFIICKYIVTYKFLRKIKRYRHFWTLCTILQSVAFCHEKGSGISCGLGRFLKRLILRTFKAYLDILAFGLFVKVRWGWWSQCGRSVHEVLCFSRYMCNVCTM